VIIPKPYMEKSQSPHVGKDCELSWSVSTTGSSKICQAQGQAKASLCRPLENRIGGRFG
jgi:hypothetical protein